MYFTIDDVRKHFDAAIVQRGSEYVRNGNVCEISLSGNSIKSSVRGEADKLYHQDILLYPTRRGIHFDGVCNCAIGHNCRHVAAALIAFLEQENAAAASTGLTATLQNLPAGVATWLQRVERAANVQNQATDGAATEAAVSVSTYRLLFVLSPDRSGRHVLLSVCKGRLRQSGEITMASPVSELHTLLTNTPAYVKPEDLDLVRLFIAMRSGVASQATSAAEPRGKIGAQLLRMLLNDQQLLWTNSYADMAKGLVFPLKEAPTREAGLTWSDQKNGLRLAWQFDPPVSGNGMVDYMLSTTPPWYADNLSCGELRLQAGLAAIPLKDLQDLVAQAPILSSDDKPVVAHLLLAQGLNQIVPLPQRVQEIIREDIKPVPCLKLGSIAQETRHGERWHDYAVLTFDYDGEAVPQGSDAPIVRERNEDIERIIRQPEVEQTASQMLTALGFAAPKKNTSPVRAVPGGMELSAQSDWLRFSGDGLRGLEVLGWRIERTPEYRYDLTEIDDWYATVADHTGDPGKNWFDLELGIVVNGTRVSLLPVLVELIRNAPHDFDPQALAAHADSDQLLATLSDGVRVALPWGRVKPILGTLGELYFADRPNAANIRLSKLDAARLAELANATQMDWSGGDNLLETGRKLNEFGGVQRVEAPKGLQAPLRDYQIQGLSWMQFLREYGFAGILADDMGLGKTIQTLAHILTEKESGRLDRPALVIAPTSLMSNWQDETARFAPDLRVLLFQGKERMPRFELIGEYDLVLTTYALLPRDEEMLQQHE
ncbi:MAG: SNF2-related protein, partial [Burkholderiaceae bacterium]|nr:SNF2-related protein [Burkholderiaceae bacterium]